MKNIKHHCFIITCIDRPILEIVREEVFIILKNTLAAHNSKQLVGPIIPSLINGFCSFFIAPDGSKEGYDGSEECDRFRAKLVVFINSLAKEDGNNVVRYAEVMYGSDDAQAQVINSN